MSELLRLLALDSGLSVEDVSRIVRTAPSRYKQYEIRKRNGGKREIAQPAREVKMLQRILIARILSDLPVHEAARAYRPGTSIKDNASPHAGSGPILKMDFENFFPSIRAEDWIAYCAKRNLLSEEDRMVTAQVFFRRKKKERIRKLSIGAPSSPALCNILLYEFDRIVTAEATERDIKYTRYADDLTFSGQRIGMLKDMIKVVEKAARQIGSPRLKVHPGKTTFVTARHRRTVTGVTLANDGSLSVGHERKRRISAGVHRASLGQLSAKQMGTLAGELAFVNVVEPQFIDRLRRKYGEQVVKAIQKSVMIPE